MIVKIEVQADYAEALLAFLNADEGLRSAVVEKLIPQNKPENIARWTAVTAALGTISRGLTLALEAERALDTAWQAERAAELKRIAGLD